MKNMKNLQLISLGWSCLDVCLAIIYCLCTVDGYADSQADVVEANTIGAVEVNDHCVT